MIFKYLYVSLREKLNKFKWYTQYKKETRTKINIRSPISEIRGQFKRILIIVPHADDELIGCYQLIKNNKQTIKLFYCGFTGDNFSIQNKKSRLIEFQLLCEKLGIQYSISRNDIEKDLKKEIFEYLPDALFLPSCIDWHEEHRKVNYITRSIIEDLQILPQIIWYQISVPISYMNIDLLVPLIKEEQETKWDEFLSIYKTQRGIPIQRLKYAERIVGFRYGLFASEVFESMSIEVWKKNLDILDDENYKLRLNSLNKSINNLNKILREAHKIYKDL